MALSNFLQNALGEFIDAKPVYARLVTYFNKNLAARKYAEVCEEQDWELIMDHLTVRTCDIDTAAREYQALGWTYDQTLEYKSEGWWAKIYRHPKLAPMFIDQNYSDAPVNQQIINRWVAKFTDHDFHHVAVRLPNGIEIEQAIELLQKKGVHFPGKITGPKGTRLRQIFTGAEVIDDTPFSVLELAQRSKDPVLGITYTGFISEQADSLMKDSVL
jgi:hypothetical protein